MTITSCFMPMTNTTSKSNRGYDHTGMVAMGVWVRRESIIYLFMFGCIIENTVNAYRHIMNVDSEDFEYFGYCQTLANDLYVYASTLSDSTI